MHLIDALLQLYLILEFLTKAYRKACSEGEAVMYRAHVAVLGDSEAFKTHFIGEPGYPFGGYTAKTGIKTYTIKSKFNKCTQKTEGWKESVSDSSDLMKEFRNAVLSHIHSVQHGGQAKGVIERLQQSHLSSPDSVGKKSSVSIFESNKTRKQGVRQNITYKLQSHEKEFETLCQKPDNKTLGFLHRNAQIQETPDNNIPYSINLWEFDSQDEFSAVNHSFLNTEALILYVMDISSDLFSPLKRNWDERNTNENSKTPAELLRYWLDLVESKAKKQNLKPNIVLLLTHTDSIFAKEENQYIESYIKTILDMVEGKPYATYITKKNIISFDRRQQSFEDIRTKLFHRITTQPRWGVKKPIRWLCLEAELLRRTTNNDDDDDDNDDDNEDAKRRPCLRVSEVEDLASAYNMHGYGVDCFLKFHHMLGDLICCPPSRGERCIITNPQWFLNKFGELVSPLPTDFNWYNLTISLLNKGIVSTEYLEKIWELDDVKFLIDLMISFDFILPLDNQKQTYLIPCMLPHKDSHIHETELTSRAIYVTKIDDALSVGTFHRLLSSCAQQSNWKLNIDGHLSYGDASFEVTKGTYLVLTQKKDIIQVSTWTSKQELNKGQVSNDDMRNFLYDIQTEIAKRMVILGVEKSTNYRMLCPLWRPSDEYVCLVEFDEKPEPFRDNFVFCPKSKKCAIHNKALGPRIFRRTGEHQKGITTNSYEYKSLVFC